VNYKNISEAMMNKLRSKLESDIGELMEHPDYGIKFDTTQAVDKESSSLTLETLLKAKRDVDRVDKVYVIASDMVPDDAYGVLFVRREDADKWNELKGEDDEKA